MAHKNIKLNIFKEDCVGEIEIYCAEGMFSLSLRLKQRPQACGLPLAFNYFQTPKNSAAERFLLINFRLN